MVRRAICRCAKETATVVVLEIVFAYRELMVLQPTSRDVQSVIAQMRQELTLTIAAIPYKADTKSASKVTLIKFA